MLQNQEGQEFDDFDMVSSGEFETSGKQLQKTASTAEVPDETVLGREPDEDGLEKALSVSTRPANEEFEFMDQDLDENALVEIEMQASQMFMQQQNQVQSLSEPSAGSESMWQADRTAGMPPKLPYAHVPVSSYSAVPAPFDTAALYKAKLELEQERDRNRRLHDELLEKRGEVAFAK
ncbi:hypothetical protein HDU91_004096, partial [Kappamyces sp. JEL0680]